MTSSRTQPSNAATLGELLRVSFSNSAEWRAGLAERYPNDARNAAAAAELSQLAETVNDIPHSLMERYVTVYTGDDDNVGFELSERENEMQKAVGFHASYANATEFVEALIAPSESGAPILLMPSRERSAS